jgi:hypothetical protein
VLAGEGATLDASGMRGSPSFPREGTLREVRSMAATAAPIPVLRKRRNIEFRSITMIQAVSYSWLVGRPSLFRLFLEQASFRVGWSPKIKIPPPVLFRRWDSRIARYDSRLFSSRRQKTHTYSRYNKGKPAWSSGRRKSRIKCTERVLLSQCDIHSGRAAV